MATYITATLALLICGWQVCFVAGSSLNFLVLGDWGGLPNSPYRTNIEKTVAHGMNNIAADKKTQFQIALGDNFYYDGVKNVKDKRFQETFEQVFTGSSLQNDWYFVAGNHDHNGDVSAQLAYSKVSHRWNFPYYYYLKSFTTPDGATVDIVLIDTVILCGNLDSDFDPILTSPSGPADKLMAEQQWAWIQKTLAASKADYLLVGGHFPVYSVAEHGPTHTLVSRLRPLLLKYKVTAYLSGHDHNLQHLTENNSMDYFVIGSANFAQNSLNHKSSVPKNSLQFFNADKVGGFAVVSVNKAQMTLTFISGENKELYHKVLKPRKLN